jgi:hypothetical protein
MPDRSPSAFASAVLAGRSCAYVAAYFHRVTLRAIPTQIKVFTHPGAEYGIPVRGLPETSTQEDSRLIAHPDAIRVAASGTFRAFRVIQDFGNLVM